MALNDAAAAANVNPFNGSSNDAAQAAVFEGLWQAGALDSQDPREAEQLRQERAAAAPREARPPAQQPPEQRQEPPQGLQPQEERSEPETGEEPEYQDLDDYLTRSGIERDSFLTLPVTVQIDGQPRQIPLAELLQGHQQVAAQTQQAQALAQERAQWEAQRQQAQAQHQAQMQQAQNLLQLAHQQLMGDYGQVNWAQLAQTDPVAYQQHWPIFQQRQLALQQAAMQIQGAQQQQLMQQQQALQGRLPQEQVKLFAARPAWRDPKAFAAAREDIRAYGERLGLTPQEWQSVSYDHRMMIILHDAAQAAKVAGQVPAALRRVRAAPQMASPGARVPRDPQAAQRITLKKAAFSPAGRRDQATQAAYFGALAAAGA